MSKLSPQVRRPSHSLSPSVTSQAGLILMGLIAASAKAPTQRLGAGRVAPTPSETVEMLKPMLLRSNS